MAIECDADLHSSDGETEVGVDRDDGWVRVIPKKEQIEKKKKAKKAATAAEAAAEAAAAEAEAEAALLICKQGPNTCYIDVDINMYHIMCSHMCHYSGSFDVFCSSEHAIVKTSRYGPP